MILICLHFILIILCISDCIFCMTSHLLNCVVLVPQILFCVHMVLSELYTLNFSFKIFLYGRWHIPFIVKTDASSPINLFISSHSSGIVTFIGVSFSFWCKTVSHTSTMLSITFIYVILIIALDTTCWSRSTSSNITWILSRLSVVFPSKFIILSLLSIYASDPGFYLPSSVMRYISYVP